MPTPQLCSRIVIGGANNTMRVRNIFCRRVITNARMIWAQTYLFG
jgi:hypothetical protein